MPGFNGTGPNSQGPLTGGGRGYCVGNLNAAGGRGRSGFGRGLGRGLGRGFGRRNVSSDYAGQYGGTGPILESDALKQQAQAMQDEINVINQRIKELETNEATENNK